MERHFVKEEGIMALLVDLYNKYNPLCTSPTPIVLQQERFLKKQIWDKNTRKYGYFYAISLTENKLNEKKKLKINVLRF